MIVIFSGGTGTPKLLQGLVPLLEERDEKIVIIANTADDWDFYGLHVCPDVDAVIFTLAQQDNKPLIDTEKWWGIRNDTFGLVNGLKTYLKEKIWFNLGDIDASICLFRTYLLKQGFSLLQAIDQITSRLQIKHKIWPMAETPVSTWVKTPECEMHLQEFWVKEHGKPDVVDVFFKGHQIAKVPAEVLHAITSARGIIIGPSNPVSSIGPIVAIPSIRSALKKTKASRVAVSPIIGESPVSGPAGKFMQAWNYPISSIGVAKIYENLIDMLFVASSDAHLRPQFNNTIIPVFSDIYLRTSEEKHALATKIIASIDERTKI
ncbi:MAG: 2-phospho-L-lactate transferase [Candidatus Hermodarchaeota archaeon]